MPFDSLPENIPQVVLDLVAARNYLDTHGWCKNHVGLLEKRCAIGAIQQVVGMYGQARTQELMPLINRQTNATLALEQAMYNSYRSKSWVPENIPSWNDMSRRTYAQVQAMFDRAIKRELAKVTV